LRVGRIPLADAHNRLDRGGRHTRASGRKLHDSMAFEELRRGHVPAQRIDARTRRVLATTFVDLQLTHFFQKALKIFFLVPARQRDVATKMRADEVEPIADLARARGVGDLAAGLERFFFVDARRGVMGSNRFD
jgi:hypothetical protein